MWLAILQRPVEAEPLTSGPRSKYLSPGMRGALLGSILLSLLAGCGGTTSHLCGEGTHESGATCIADTPALACGPGTQKQGAQCVPAAAVACGSGTHLDTGVCISDGTATCGAGTHQVSGTCVADMSVLTCGTGTHAANGACVPDADPTTCGRGTHLAAGVCVPDGTTLTCGAGTHVDTGVCVADPGLECGAGTIQSGNSCVLMSNANYDVRVAVLEIPADGYSVIPVFAIGRAADGTPSTEEVIFSVTRLGVGSFTPLRGRLTTVGLNSIFVPCNAATSPGCTGPFQITLSLASDPNTIVASTQTLNLVEPMGVGSSAPCLVGGNVVFFHGDPGDYIAPGNRTITMGRWQGSATQNTVRVHVDPADSTQGLWWDLDFNTTQLGQAIQVQVYERAERSPFASPGHPGLEISGDGRGCNTLSGRFQVEDLAMSGGSLVSFTATFEQHCEGGGSALRGCVHIEP